MMLIAVECGVSEAETVEEASADCLYGCENNYFTTAAIECFEDLIDCTTLTACLNWNSTPRLSH